MIGQIEIPYYLTITLVLLIIATLLIYLGRYSKGKFNDNWWRKCFLLFLGIYGLIVGIALFLDIYYQLSLNEFDLNSNGIFEENEQVDGQQEAFSKVVNNTGRNLSIFTGAIFSLIISLLVFLIGRKTSE